MEKKELIFWDWPATRQPIRTLIATAFILVAVATAGSVHWVFGVVAAMLLIASLGEVLLPSRYRIDSNGIVVIGLHLTTHKRWDEVERVIRFEDGVIVQGRKVKRLPFRRNQWPIRCRQNQEIVMDMVMKHIAKDGLNADDR